MGITRKLKSERIRGVKCTIEKFPNEFIEGKCLAKGVVVGAYKTKSKTIKELKKMLKKR